jgi:cation diffusion facilitator family transporter
MHDRHLDRYMHTHDLGQPSAANERRTLWVFGLTTMTMVVEIVAGYLTGSMALLADGWHMGTHAFALGISLSAYWLARRYARSPAFAFGTGKFGVLAGYTSALFLGAAALAMMWESVARLLSPVRIAFDQAIVVAVVGLAVNAASIIILHHRRRGPGRVTAAPEADAHTRHGEHAHPHPHPQGVEAAGHSDHDHGHGHDDHSGHDHNYRSAYLHVVADALTSAFAIVALLSGRFLGWAFMDPVMGVVGGIMVCRWTWHLLCGTALVLLDGGVDQTTTEAIRMAVEADGDSRVADLHVWRVSSHDLVGALSVVSGTGLTSGEYQTRLAGIPRLQHLTIEVQPCQSERDCA